MCTVTIGTFLCVPSVITYDKSTDFNTLRIVCIVGWVLLGWIYEYGVSQQTDLFCRQIDKTKLVCSYIQLKPSSSDDILELTKRILRTLEFRDPRLSLYGMYYMNTGLVLRIAASSFVYITVQLQILIPAIEENRTDLSTTLP
ncbi:uncharacterized protein LOC123721024 [Papilio machaon]|uniref:uncharacterized protein LOC123721024 n=1 Tax=Papilio machaon TaxID=76193 RepID=UPI001E666174|nr:uncharacterized protein LOC123721024 [Papilio machaon]